MKFHLAIHLENLLGNYFPRYGCTQYICIHMNHIKFWCIFIWLSDYTIFRVGKLNRFHFAEHLSKFVVNWPSKGYGQNFQPIYTCESVWLKINNPFTCNLFVSDHRFLTTFIETVQLVGYWQKRFHNFDWQRLHFIWCAYSSYPYRLIANSSLECNVIGDEWLTSDFLFQRSYTHAHKIQYSSLQVSHTRIGSIQSTRMMLMPS